MNTNDRLNSCDTGGRNKTKTQLKTAAAGFEYSSRVSRLGKGFLPPVSGYERIFFLFF